jgi:hypothetical protein
MKTIFAVLFMLCASSAFGQYSAISNQPVVLTLPEHIEHATIHDMGTEQSLLGSGGSAVTVATGERPLWEFGSVKPPEPPLGDVARAYRKQKLTGKKAEIILEKQGS